MDPSEIENLQLKKTPADSVLLSLFMKLMENATILTPPSRILLSVRTQRS